MAEYGVCRSCGERVRLKKNGGTVKHSYRVDDLHGRVVFEFTCSASGNFPVAQKEVRDDS